MQQAAGKLAVPAGNWQPLVPTLAAASRIGPAPCCQLPAASRQLRRQILGSVTPRWAWYFPRLSLYDVSQTSSLWKNSTCAMPSLA